jgi:hypothetical protein
MSSLLSRIIAVFRPERLDREIDEEQEFHIACRIEELVENGMEEEEAARQARREFGNRSLAHAESRDARLLVWLESTAQDIRYGFRRLRRSPMFTAMAALSLTIGIGANNAL